MEVGEKTSKRGFAATDVLNLPWERDMSMSRNGSFPSRLTSEVKVILGCCWLRYLRKRGTWFKDRKRTTYL